MKKLIKTTLIVAVIGVFTIFMTSCGSKEKCNTNCCQTEECKQNCIDSGCCKEGETCDITNHKECKHKCCDTAKKECHTEGEKSCCKTK